MITTEKPTARILDGLLRCPSCGRDLHHSTMGHDHSSYKCPSCVSDGAYPSIPCHQLENTILREITNMVMTVSNTEMLAQALSASACQLPAYAPQTLKNPAAHQNRVRTIATDPEIYTIADNLSRARSLLAKLIEHIDVYPHRAVVHYAVPLPYDSSLPGSYDQNIELPGCSE